MTDAPQRLKLLVVDDESGMRAAIARSLRDFTVSLESVGGEVTLDIIQAASGEEAILKLESEKPDMMLLDHKLPGISGLDVLAWLSDNRPEVLTVMITAYASLETAISATKKGAFDFLAKPFTPAELKASVRKALSHLMALKKARQLEEEKKRVRFQFISVLAHELKAPLGAIEGYLYILQDRSAVQDPAAYDRVVERCMVRLSGMRKLIMDILDLTRIESGQRKRELVQVDLRELAGASIDTMASDASRRGITMSLEAPGGQCVLEADRGEMEIILNNLVSNAVKYNRDGGMVTVRLERQDGAVRISVSDTGIGMTAEEVAKLFGEFVRIRNEKTKNILGSGLGLSIVQKLANAYGGTVTVESRPDEGSTFTVTLPVRPAAAGSGE
jgi:two-component system, sensor histidine kinase and response regulator